MWRFSKLISRPSFTVLRLHPRNLERTVQQLYSGLGVLFLAQIQTDPATFGQQVVRFGKVIGNHFITHRFWEWNVYQSLTVYVPDFSSAKAVFCASKTVRVHRDCCVATSL
jgi:hypothetical protein